MNRSNNNSNSAVCAQFPRALLRRNSMSEFTRRFLIWLGFSAALASISLAQQAQKPLTNDSVVAMVKSNVPESVVISTIQSNPSKFDISPNGIIALHKAGVTQGELDAIIAAASGGAPSPAPAAGNPASTPNAKPPANGGVPSASSPAPGAGNPAPASNATPPANAATPSSASAAPPASKSRMPNVAVIQDGASQQIALEKTQLAQTKTKPTSMTSLAADSALTQQVMQAGINTATMSAATHLNSGIGGSTVQEAGGIFSGMLSQRKPTVTYVWAIPSPASTTVLQTTSPTLAVNYSNTPGVNPDDFEPAIVKLTPAQNAIRIVGATQGKPDAQSSPAADWQIYSNFLEERVPLNLQKAKPGTYQISAKSGLFPGEYAVVLRPVSKTMKFSGGDVARAQGDGLMFDAVWSFRVSDDAQ